MSGSRSSGGLDSFLESYGRGLVRHRVTSLLSFILVTLVIVWAGYQRVQASGLPIDFTPQAMFLNEGDEVQHQREVEAIFGVEDTTLILLVEGELSDDTSIAYLTELHDVLEGAPKVERVDSIVNAQINIGEGWIEWVHPLDAFAPDEALERINQDALTRGVLLSKDHQLTAFRVRLDEMEEIAVLSPAVHEVMDRVDAVERPDGLKLHKSGVPWVRTEIVELMIEDNLKFLPGCIVMFAITICVLFRRVWLALAPLLGVNIAALWAMSILTASGAIFNILSVLVPVLVVIIGVADGIHLVGRYREEVAQTPDDREGAMGRTTRAMAVACFLTTFTTATGFGSLMVADTPVIADFGRHAAVAIMICFVAIMLVVPTLVSFIPMHRVLPPNGRVEEGSESRWLSWTDAWVRSRPRMILGLTLLVVAVAAWIGRDVRSNSFLLEMYGDDHPTSIATNLASEKLGGVIPSYYHLKGPEGSMLEPENLRKMQELQAAMESEDPILWTRSPADGISELQRSFLGEPGIPEGRDGVAQLMLMGDMGEETPMSKVLDESASNARIIALLDDAGGRAYNESRIRLQTQADALFEGTEIQTRITGDGMIAAQLVHSLIDDLLKSIGLVLAVIAITMLFLLRSLRLALIAVLPNLVPLIFITASLAIMGSDLQTSNIVTFTVALGLAVDDTIHFVVRYAQERREGKSLEEAIRKSFLGAGHAIVLTSILLILGFCTLMGSDLTSTRHFGVLSAVTMVAAILGDLLLLPALLHLFGRSQKTAPQ